MMEWDLTPSWTLKTEWAGQYALNPLLPSMGFALGADQGLLGLPAQWTSGDSGWLGIVEAPWTFAEGKQGTVQLVPYAGSGGVTTKRKQQIRRNSLFTYGLFIRYKTSEKNFQFEFGIVDNAITKGKSNDSENSLLGRGIYLTTTYLF